MIRGGRISLQGFLVAVFLGMLLLFILRSLILIEFGDSGISLRSYDSLIFSLFPT
jgi:hypothetical protein